MASFEAFESDSFAVNGSSKTITKRKDGAGTAYGNLPIVCGQNNNGVHHYELKVDNNSGGYVFIGIDAGRNNKHSDFSDASTYHYALGGSGYFYEKGIKFVTGNYSVSSAVLFQIVNWSLSRCPLCFVQINRWKV